MADRFVHAEAPVRIYWEVTRACDLACRHCRAEASPHADPRELTTAEAMTVLDGLAPTGGGRPPHVIFTGGDPLKRADLWDLIEGAKQRGLGVSVSPSATPLLTDETLHRFAAAGVQAISLSLDAPTAEQHDALRGVPGCFDRTLHAARVATDVKLPYQVNTLVCNETVNGLVDVYDLVRRVHATRWSLFFLVTVGRGSVLQPISPERAEEVLAWLATCESPGLVITTTEAPQYRRVKAEAVRAAHGSSVTHGTGAHDPGRGIRDGNGVMFISHDGEVYPSGFLPVSAGNVRTTPPLEIYRASPMFVSLRDADGFDGRCGVCDYRSVCGGSRARAFMASGDVLGEDPLCTHEPHKRHLPGYPSRSS